MPFIKISGLTTATAVSATNQFEINQNGASRSVELSVLDSYIRTNSPLPVVVSVSSASAAVRITQTGAGNAILVEDEANPDSTPFVVDNAGNVGIGTSNPAVKFDLAGDYKEGVVTANTGTGYTISLAAGTVQILTLTGNCTFTFPSASPAGRSFLLLLRQDGTGGRAATWPANVRWPGGTAPPLTGTANRTDKFVFTADGTNWLGSNAGQNYSA